MHRDPPAYTNPNTGDLAVFNPHSGEAFAAAGYDAEVGEGVHEGFLQDAQVGVQVLPVVLQVENGIADQLSGTVVGGLTTTVDLEYRMRKVRGVSQTALIARSPDGIDRCVLQQENCFGNRPRTELSDMFLLKLEGSLIRGVGAEPAGDHGGEGLIGLVDANG